MSALPFIEAIRARDKKFYKLMKDLQELVYGESSLDAKTKMMISLAVDAAVGANDGVKAIANVLRQMGVTDEQINEVLRITYFTKANSTLVTSLAAFEK
ncbi:alkylhydroperoxidase AhpD family core domain-containing protein [Carboxydocella sporoproducens DSM 16521]|uniref:Alkylhydroperoxidase AhpD family core domain-containing protein n=2 Tax=Carboxydocella TaxID=178898 RepID=A0A1T4SLZ6_9FIRM|nr:MULTISPECIES: carboxymuconolactone decarboxylase family protein [Carboxydocella]AVX21576.1 alkylhydroperoxidase AhpD family core domain-containing protein [Carboxydocella thermautotrophica]SKA28918.1 alkylhydroperoxidase AhpD family core domain-containing protein [Carboxydocella sporoproducens DSM 16521]